MMESINPWFGGTRNAGVTMILAFVVFTVGALMWWRRQGDPSLVSTMGGAYVTWERGLVVAGLLLNVAGLFLFDSLMRGAGNHYLGRLGIYGYAFAALFALTYEITGLMRGDSAYGLIVIYVVLAFLAQAAMGVALLATGFLPAWVGWLAIGWNLLWLIVLPFASPRDIYIPVLHHFVPLVIGGHLLSGAWRTG
jgi:hypothetical protein